MSHSARAYAALQQEAHDDERRALESQGHVAPNRDGSPRTVVQSRLAQFGESLVNVYRARCSCAWNGHEYGAAAYRLALAERNAHQCSTTHQALTILRQNGLL